MDHDKMTTMTDDSLNLTDRRRVQTRHEIFDAAIGLFERQGVEATTVAEIAAAAGISPRTFFRYFESKESAGIPGQFSLRDRVARFTPRDGSSSEVLRQVEALFEEEILTAVQRQEDPPRLARLFATETLLLEAAAAQLQRISKGLQSALLEHCPSLDRATTLLITDLATVTWHTSWDVLGQRYRMGEQVEPIDNYREHCQMLREITR